MSDQWKELWELEREKLQVGVVGLRDAGEGTFLLTPLNSGEVQKELDRIREDNPEGVEWERYPLSLYKDPKPGQGLEGWQDVEGRGKVGQATVHGRQRLGGRALDVQGCARMPETEHPNSRSSCDIGIPRLPGADRLPIPPAVP